MELLTTVGALGILATAALAVITHLLVDVRKVKIDNDVASLNQAIKSYTAEGGDLSTATTVENVLSALKSTASDKEIIAGYRGSYVDPRLEAVMQDSTEAATSDWRAIWDDSAKLMIVADTGADGVKEFRLNDALMDVDYGQDDREQMNQLAKVDDWIWDFDDPNPAAALIGQTIATSDTPDAGALSTPDALSRLLPPDFSPPGDLFEFFSFPPSVELTNPNDAGTTVIKYALNGGSWQTYTAPITLEHDDQISSYIELITPDPDIFNSFVGTELYRSEDFVLSGSSTGVFKEVIGAGGLVSSIAAGGSNNQLNYGEALSGGDQNELGFTGSNFANIIPEQTFTVGQLTYLNSSTIVGTSPYEVKLQVDLNFSTPSATESIDVVLALESTKNYPWLSADQKADYVRFGELSTDFSAFFGGVTYYLNLEFVYAGAAGYSTVDVFHVHEGATATADIIGYFSNTPIEAPDTTGGSTPPPSLP
ncbi:MAG: hypothetical protein ACI957_005172 [Verrucomicrobiales bacterium]|jgi:hypothetical protein